MDKRNNFSIREIAQSEFDDVAHIMTDAFVTNPAYSLIFRNKEHLAEGLLWVFKANLLIHNRNQALTKVIIDNHSDKIIGTYTLVPPEGMKKSISAYFSIGIPHFLYRFGVKPLLRMQDLDACNKKAIVDSMETSKFHYLSMVASSIAVY